MIQPDSDVCNIIITRLARPDWETFGGIELKEWLDLISADPSLEAVDEITGRNPATGEFIKIELENTARYLDEFEPLFRYENGEILADWINLDGQEKAKEIAGKLKANLITYLD